MSLCMILGQIEKRWSDNISLLEEFHIENYDAIILAVAHDKFRAFDLRSNSNQILFDIKSFIDHDVDGRL